MTKSSDSTTTTNHGSEKRQHPRRLLSTQVTLRDTARGRTLRGATVDINPLGMLLSLSEPMSVGDVLALAFPSPASGRMARVSGDVVRVVRLDDGRYRMGVEFLTPDGWLFSDLCDYVYEVPEKRELTLIVKHEPEGG